MAVQTNVSLQRVSATSWVPLRWVYIAIAGVVLFNLAMLLAYQYNLAADFPFQDEIGYLNRLVHVRETGLFHYLFDPYWHYYMPTQLGIWYQFYSLAHLNIMAVRYTGAVISALASLLLCVMLYRKSAKINALTLLVILCGPFMICSYNHWASLDQSIEAVVEPLLFALTLALVWIAEKIRGHPKSARPSRGGSAGSACLSAYGCWPVGSGHLRWLYWLRSSALASYWSGGSVYR